MKKLKILFVVLIVSQFTGCIVINTASYEVTVNKDGTGTARITLEDLKSNAENDSVFSEDLKIILDSEYQSQTIVSEMDQRGMNLTSKNFVVEENKLNAIISFEFNNVNSVEGIMFEDPYYYLTIPSSDSIISTNGQITKTSEYQRIMWDKSINTLKFKMFSDDTDKEGLKPLAPHYLKAK